MKKVLTNRVVLNTFIMTLFIFSIEMIIRNFAGSKLFDFGTIRILLASFICGLGISFITHFFKKLPARIIHIVFVLAIGLYEFIEFGLFNFIGFFMGVGNTEQGTKVISYILDFLKSLKMEYYFILLPTILFVLYYIFIDRKIMKNKTSGIFATIFFTLISILFVSPILIVLMNSFKKKAFISLEPFKLPNEKSYVGLENYLTSISKYDFIKAVGWTVFITVLSVIVILVCCSMCAWYITRVQNKITKLIYLLCVFSMVIPFQMVMFTLSGTADTLGLNTPWGLIIVYLGFGAGLAVFMFCGFVKSIPVEIEEAAMIDGCNPIRTFFSVVLPIMKPTYISVGILEAMWIWNDFLLPYLILDIKKYKTISIIIQYMKGSYGRVDMGAIMACLIMAVIPVIVFYLSCQKYIIKGVAAGAVKG